MSARQPAPHRLDLTARTPRKLLLAASTGGHIAQLVRLAPGLGATDDSLWVSFDSQQTRSLLRGKRTLLVPYIKPRDWRGTLTAVKHIDRALAEEQFDAAVSTGAALALAALPTARRRGIPALYIESVSRVLGPSMSGRLLSLSRLTETRTQHRSWAGGRWGLHPSVLETFTIEDRPAPQGRPLRIFVTLGTIQGYRFDSLIDSLLATGLVGDDTTWQLGFTTRDDLPGRVVQDMDAAAFDREIREADVVVTHAGVGTILGLLEAGVYPVAVVRRSSRGEHVDDHQAQIAGLMNESHIGTAVEADELTAEVLLEAAHRRIVGEDGELASRRV
ncbi:MULTISPECIES: glycosyltransferase [Microbacterium]|uniref:glycosyltransferase n=1 Tax=Microbacterium TaxID=33882 RepID=UPI002784CC87|nr:MULTISPECIES: glycosyltransferase [Microbacterium]MDQ1084620.1 UDP-N-acetylglucosamine--N-acetylmuramyl-(pentapeptide) pyrophosphoryl-undecaprenol N-acetylglucosamine transferase [Microbacterium sp. SORGH_AS_0344]MDQ1170103.1 UDP-N-acetylglucosamine--N-acetylmuramyl-(pentapeptide) pyrophosphoryl-undecaprenol N-acetylglucosamine transferase [Microbacterium proteolyticum]